MGFGLNRCVFFAGKGETKTVSFELPVSSLAYYDANPDHVVEPGTFTIMVGKSSMDEDILEGKITFKP